MSILGQKQQFLSQDGRNVGFQAPQKAIFRAFNPSQGEFQGSKPPPSPILLPPPRFWGKKGHFGVRSVDFGSETPISVSRWQKCQFPGPPEAIFLYFHPPKGELKPPDPIFGVKSATFGVKSSIFGVKSSILGSNLPLLGKIFHFWVKSSIFGSNLPFLGPNFPFLWSNLPFWGQIFHFWGQFFHFWGQICHFCGLTAPLSPPKACWSPEVWLWVQGPTASPTTRPTSAPPTWWSAGGSPSTSRSSCRGPSTPTATASAWSCCWVN